MARIRFKLKHKTKQKKPLKIHHQTPGFSTQHFKREHRWGRKSNSIHPSDKQTKAVL